MISRRQLLERISAAFAAWPLRATPLALGPGGASPRGAAAAAFRLTPHYRAKSPLEDVLRHVEPGLDNFPTEKYAEEIEAVLKDWTGNLVESPPDFRAVGNSLSARLSAFAPSVVEETRLRLGPSLEIFRRRLSDPRPFEREAFVKELASSLQAFSNFVTAEFRVTSLRVLETSPLALATRIRYDLMGPASGAFREERIGTWELEWERDPTDGKLRIRKWRAFEETRSRAARPIFEDRTAEALGRNASYREQLLGGTDRWRTVLDGACGIDVYGNNGVAVGDIENDGFDDLYVCQPAGLPNRLYRNRGDGRFEDSTEAAGVGVLDSTASALFADLDNDGYQDLVVVRSAGPLLFLNQRNGTFRYKPDAFRFAQPPQGTFTGAAIADYDCDGKLDIYFCLYLYYQGLDQYRFPVPYHDAQNGPPNFLFHNNGDGTFADATAPSGMNQNNNRFSFACGWCDYNNDGWPDLYVANDFGRKNLYRNNGDGTFTDVARAAGVEDVGAGMSVCWFDYDGDGKQDLYVADMWSAAGQRVAAQEEFLKGAPEDIRALYGKHAGGNSLFRNEGKGRFRDTSAAAGVEMGRWAWSSDAWDFDHDGDPDLYIASGMISGPDTRDLSSFFWRQVVAESPLQPAARPNYEKGWNAINELIRSDGTWSGYERNVFYVNCGDGSFADASGVAGLDFADDSRAFALADFNHDGRLEIFLKNRTAPQLRVLQNVMENPGDSIAFRLRGTKSNRDAIGAEVAVEAGGRKQTKFLQAGSGFLSQHSKELFFGLGRNSGAARASVRWPSGLVEVFEKLPPNHRIEIEEGARSFRATPFVPGPRASSSASVSPPGSPAPEPLPAASETWLLDPLPAPDFALPDLTGRRQDLKSFAGRPLLLNFWALNLRATSCPPCRQELRVLEQKQKAWAARGLGLATVNVDVNVNEPGEVRVLGKFVREEGYTFSVLLGSADMLGVYNVFYRYLFDRRRDLGVPTTLLIDPEGLVVKIYQGPVEAGHVENDLASIPRTSRARVEKALPFAGDFYGGEFRRNHFTFGVAYFQRGYLDQSISSFEFVLRLDPANAEAEYNLGTLYLKKRTSSEARRHFRRAVELKPAYPDALNSLGLIAAEEGKPEEAVSYFKQALGHDPDYAIAYQNLGNLYRRQGRFAEAEPMLENALHLGPEDPEVNYSLGMLYAQKDDAARAGRYLEHALKLRPEYPEALNNLGVLYLRTGRPAEAEKALQSAIQVAPDFDQPYLNLAKLYAGTGERGKAGQILRQLLEKQPKHEIALKALEELGE